MTIGIEIPLVAKALAPLVGELCKGASGAFSNGFQKWKATGFANRLAEKLASADKVKTIWSRTEEVSLNSIYYPSSISFGTVQHKTVNSIADFPGGNIVIEGIVGHGKSMFLQYLYLQELAGNGAGKLPIFILLRTLTAKRDLLNHIYEALEKIELSGTADIFDYLAKSGKLTLLLDGFDELDEDLVGDTINQLDVFSEKYPQLKIIITSRPSNDIQMSRHFQVVNLNEIRKQDYKGFLSKLGLAFDWADEIINAIEKSPAKVTSLISTPLMLTLVVLVYEAEKEVPTELPDFFERLFLTMFSHHDRLKAGFRRKHHSGLSERHLQLLFEAFCFVAMRQKFGRSLGAEQFALSFEKAEKYVLGEKCKAEDFRKDITKVSCLMLEEGLDLTTFLHYSICEYFAASFIKRSSEKFAQNFYEYVVRNSNGWEVVMSFLEKIDSYRCARYFIVPTASAFLDRINSTTLADAEDSDWYDFLTGELPDFMVDYVEVPDASDTFSPSSYGPFSTRGDWGDQLTSDMVRCITRASKSTLPAPLTKKELDNLPDLFSMQVTNAKNEYSVPLRTAMNEYGDKAFLTNFKMLERSTRKRLESAEEVVRIEEEKTKLFDFDDL